MTPLRAVPGAHDPLALLEVCHARIEAQLAGLESMARSAPSREAARAALRYFDTAAAEHQRDEDEDLFPLLRELAAQGGRPEIGAVIDELGRDHATMARQWSRLGERLDALARGREEQLDEAEVASFAWLHRRHMEKESAVLLPFARETLGRAACAAFAERMAERRKTAA